MGCFRISIFISPIFFWDNLWEPWSRWRREWPSFFFGFQSYQRWKNNLIGIEPQFLYMTFSILILNRHIVMEKHDLTPFYFPVSPSFFFSVGSYNLVFIGLCWVFWRFLAYIYIYFNGYDFCKQLGVILFMFLDQTCVECREENISKAWVWMEH